PSPIRPASPSRRRRRPARCRPRCSAPPPTGCGWGTRCGCGTPRPASPRSTSRATCWSRARRSSAPTPRTAARERSSSDPSSTPPSRPAHLPVRDPAAPKERPMPRCTTTLTTWSGGVSWTPQQVLVPTTQEEVVAAVRAARSRRRALRMLGGGHSFSALAATDGITLPLDGCEGLVSADPATGLVTLRGGTRLWAVAELLAPYGLALSMMGDIDRQSIAGAIQTGTHGTGGAFTGFAGMVRGLRLVLADGSVVDTSPTRDRDLFEAARLGLGSVGVVLEVTLQCVLA